MNKNLEHLLSGAIVEAEAHYESIARSLILRGKKYPLKEDILFLKRLKGEVLRERDKYYGPNNYFDFDFYKTIVSQIGSIIEELSQKIIPIIVEVNSGGTYSAGFHYGGPWSSRIIKKVFPQAEVISTDLLPDSLEPITKESMTYNLLYPRIKKSVIHVKSSNNNLNKSSKKNKGSRVDNGINDPELVQGMMILDPVVLLSHLRFIESNSPYHLQKRSPLITEEYARTTEGEEIKKIITPHFGYVNLIKELHHSVRGNLPTISSIMHYFLRKIGVEPENNNYVVRPIIDQEIESRMGITALGNTPIREVPERIEDLIREYRCSQTRKGREYGVIAIISRHPGTIAYNELKTYMPKLKELLIPGGVIIKGGEGPLEEFDTFIEKK